MPPRRSLPLRPLQPRRGPISQSPGTAVLVVAFFVALALLAGCSDASDSEPTRNADRAESPAEEIQNAAHSDKPVVKPAKKSEAKTAPRAAHERPLPNFGGRTLAGTNLEVSDLLGSRLVLFIFNPELDRSGPVAEAVARVAKDRGEHNFEVVGVGVGSTSSKLSRFAKENALEFPIIDDSGGLITQKLRLRQAVALLGADAEGYMSFGIGSFPKDGDIAGTVEANLRTSLRLPSTEESESKTGQLLVFPQAPSLGVRAMSNGEVLETEALRGRAAVVIFFLHTCPHCHKALASIKTTLAGIEESQRPRLVAVSIQNDPRAIRSSMKELGLDYFDPYLDPGQAATDRWGVTGGVPAIFVLDAQGRIRHRSSGWNEKRDAGVLRMKLAKAAGATVPMLLDPTGYSGSEVCSSCHEQEFATWQFTQHASAFSTLVTHTADRRTDCVGCHVVGFEETGGYDFTSRPPHLENVGCESCHGRGGPHLSPGFVTEDDYAPVCGTCHNPTHSLSFEYESFHARVSHEAIAALSDSERADLLDGVGPARDLLPTKADYVGSNACQSCHEAEFKTWEASPHGHAVATLEKEGNEAKTECLQCHTTGYGKTGGFPAEAPVAEHPDLARVGCESCHGPGSDHIGEKAKRVGTILSLGDKCDSCVILKVCGGCHDDANDPGFQFEVEERIEAQRHGTIESAATRAGESAWVAPPSHPLSTPARAFEADPKPSSDRARLRSAFEQLADQNASADAAAFDPS